MIQISKARLGALSLTALLGAGALTLNGGQARAGVDDITFDASTTAYGAEFRLTNPSIPTGIAIEGSGPTSEAKLNSLPQSNSFASFPYPGEFGATLPGLASSLTGVQLPDYPLYVSSAGGSDDPAGGAHFPGIDLTAKTGDNLSTSKAVAFSQASGYTAESTVSQGKDGAVSAVSTATQNGLQIGAGVSLSGVVSTARATLDAFGKVTTNSDLAVGRFTAPAMTLTLPENFNPPNSPSIPNPFQGQVLTSPDLSYTGGNFYVTIPGAGPQKFPVPDSAVVDAFKAMGIDQSIQKAITTPTGVTAPTMVIKTVLPALPANQFWNGETPITYTIGRTTADIVGTADAAAAPALTSGIAPAAGTPSAGLPAGAQVDSAGLGLPSTAGQLPGAASGALAPAAVGGEQLVSAQNGVELPGIAPFFFVLVIAAVLALAGGQVLAYMGVRSAWKS